jgi:hypothetical protein
MKTSYEKAVDDIFAAALDESTKRLTTEQFKKAVAEHLEVFFVPRIEEKSDLDRLRKIARGEQAPAWKPEDLIGKLVRAWDNEEHMSKSELGVLIELDNRHPVTFRIGLNWYTHIRPLTEAEALALVWRPKPKTRYDWSRAPGWATHGVRDKKGPHHWLIEGNKCDPEKTSTGWSCGISGGYWEDMRDSCILDASGDWRDSLERRPE